MMIKNLFVTSANRDKSIYPYGNNYAVHCTQPIRGAVKAELLYASVPNSMFNVDAEVMNNYTSNVFITVDGTKNFRIPNGFYSGQGLAGSLTDAIETGSGVQVDYLDNEGKFLFYSTTAFTVTLPSLDIATVLGFDRWGSAGGNVYNSRVVTGAGPDYPLYAANARYTGYNFLVSDKIGDLNPYPFLFLDIKELRTTNNYDAKAVDGNTISGQSMSRSFGLIPVDTFSGGIQAQTKTGDFNFTVDYGTPLNNIERLTVEWVDRNGRRVHFNGAETNSFLLRFTCVPI